MPGQAKNILDHFYSFLVSGKELGKKTILALGTSGQPVESNVFEGVDVILKKSAVFVGWDYESISYGGINEPGAIKKVAESGDFLAFAKEYMHDEDPIVVRNALCALTKSTDEELSQLNPIREELIDMAINCKNSSIRRALFSIILRLDMNKENIRTDFLDHCLCKLTNPEEVPSVQVLCMKLAYKMC